MGALLLLLLAANEVQVADLPEPGPEAPRGSVFFSPVATGGMLSLGAVGPGGLYLPIGGVMSLGPHWGVTAEASVGVPFMSEGRMNDPGWAFSAAIGPTWFLREQGTDGFFVTAKLSFQVSKPMSFPTVAFNAGAGPLPISTDTSYTFLIGGDVGYQWHLKKLTLALLLGGSIGYGYNRSEQIVTPFDWTSSRPGGDVAYAINVDLLRIGYAF
jgi:hypothetical protein